MTGRRPSDSTLASRLRRQIEDAGPITFAQFMEHALYDPAGGFYSRRPVGERGDFVTSPHVSPVFGQLVARQVQEFWDLLGSPNPFRIIDVGAGDGTLARQILEGLDDGLRAAARYIGVEPGVAGRRALEHLSDQISAVARMEDLAGVEAGCVIANELLDNLPFHRVRGGPDGAVELFVSLQEDRFVLIERPPSSGRIASLAPHLRIGEEAVVSPAGLDFIDRAAALLDRGYVWIIDYGAGDHGALVHGYRGHRVAEDVLTDPGSRDITAGVDFAALVRHARRLGLSVWGPVTQREALVALGFRELDQQARAEQVRAVNARCGLEALRAYSDRNRASLLVDPSGLGGFLVLCLGVGMDQAPRSVRR